MSGFGALGRQWKGAFEVCCRTRAHAEFSQCSIHCDLPRKSLPTVIWKACVHDTGRPSHPAARREICRCTAAHSWHRRAPFARRSEPLPAGTAATPSIRRAAWRGGGVAAILLVISEQALAPARLILSPNVATRIGRCSAGDTAGVRRRLAACAANPRRWHEYFRACSSLVRRSRDQL